MIVSGDASDSFSASKFSSFSNLFLFFLIYVCIYGCGFELFRGVFPELFPLEADPQVKRYLRDVFFAEDDLALVLAQDLDAQRQALELLDQDPERLRDAGLERVVALD